jgi:MFS family permease
LSASDAVGAVLTRPVLAVLGLTFLGFTLEYVLRPVIPLIVIDRGGGVVVIGVVAAVHALPSILFRPAIGRLIDGWNQGQLLRIGAVLTTLAPIGLMLPGLAALLPVRFVQGTGWAMYIVSNHALMARLSPAGRRGEASGYFMAMPALAYLIGPGIGVGLYLSTGVIGPALIATGLGIAATSMAFRLQATGPKVRIDKEPQRPFLERLTEPSALPSTLMIAAFMLPQSLFTVFAPVYALEVGAPLEWLAVYFPLYGLVLFVTQLAAGRASDRYGRHAAIVAGCAAGALGVLVALAGGSLLTFAIGAGFYALGVSLVSPTVSALTIDRAPPDRLGAAMATYSVGYQLSSGVGSLIWGGVLAVGGFSTAFVFAIVCQVGTIAISTRMRSTEETPSALTPSADTFD